MTNLLNSDARRIPLADNSVDCCVSSPPYWGLRNYQIPDQLGLEPTPDCGAWNRGKHEPYIAWEYDHDTQKDEPVIQWRRTEKIQLCGKCFVCHLVSVYREVWRVLKPWGSVWLNLGDSFNDKQLIGIPWRVAFALQADGWWLRSDIIWHKPNPMPESVTDRPTKAHEYLFLLTKRARYYYDADAVREGNKREWGENNIGSNNRINTGVLDGKVPGRPKDPHRGLANTRPNPSGRNRRTVWSISTKPYKGAHFATFPPALVEPCIKAGTSERGNCPECGKPWERVSKKEYPPMRKIKSVKGGIYNTQGTFSEKRFDEPIEHITIGWQPTCGCHLHLENDSKFPKFTNGWLLDNEHAFPVPAIVLDPFAGSGTTLMVARELGRDSVGLDLSFDYLSNQARKRLSLDKLAGHRQAKQVDAAWQDTPLFAEVESG